jgi:hypothetical protein
MGSSIHKPPTQVLDDGSFSEDSTFQLTDWMAHVPKEVLAKNFRVNSSAFDHIPARQLWMLPSAVPIGTAEEQGVTSPQGTVPLPFTFAASKATATNVSISVFENPRKDMTHWYTEHRRLAEA